MTGASLAFPGGRTLAGWWRQLAAWQPRALWVGHLLLHHVEALIERTQRQRPDAIDRLVLQALALAPGAALERIDEHLHVGPQLLLQVLHGLAAEGLADAAAGWAPTDLGRQALERGDYPRPVHERRSFFFVAGPRAGAAPQFIDLGQPATVAWQPGEDWSFDVGCLQACLDRPPDWKQRRAFPIEVERLVGADAPGPAPCWQRVLLDRPERLTAALVLAADGERLLGFTVRPEGWSLHSEAPVLSLDADWREVLPELAEPLPEEEWRQAWRAWCQPRGLTAVSNEVVRLQPEGHQLLVVAAPRLLERLRATRSDVLRDESWLLAGSGRLRPAARLKIVEAPPG